MQGDQEQKGGVVGEGGAGAPILYCRCAYAKVVRDDVKDGVLEKLCASGRAFTAVADLCEMSARRDPMMAEIAGGGGGVIVACFPRAVRWLFHAAGSPLQEDSVRIVNMRELDVEGVSREALGLEGNEHGQH